MKLVGDPSDPTVGSGIRASTRPVIRATICLVAVTLLAFAGVRHNGFVNWDDVQLLVHNEAAQAFGASNLRWMFSTTFGGHYQPLSWVSYAVDYWIWRGLSAPGVHLTNVLLHVVTTLGFFFVAREIIERRLAPTPSHAAVVGGLAAAVLFAVHPLRVESVAWATERRDVLSGALLMPCLWLYLRSTVDNSFRPVWFGGAVVLYALSLLSKSIGFVLPGVLLVLDLYLGRLRPTPGGSGPRRSRVLIEKAWFAAPACAIAALALAAQRHAGALWSFDDHPLALRVAQAFYGVCFYLWKTALPWGLIPFYGQDPASSPFDPQNVVGAVVVVVLLAGCWAYRKRWPCLITAWAVYLMFLAPVLGIAQSGPQVVADRYSYLSCTPWAMVAGGGLAAFWPRLCRYRPVVQSVVVAAAVCIVGAMVWQTRRQVLVWRDSHTLWTAVLAQEPDSGLAHANLAYALLEEGDLAGARRHSERALDLLPGNLGAHGCLGRVALIQEDFSLAEWHLLRTLDIALAVGRDTTNTRLLLADLYTRTGRPKLAESQYQAIHTMEERRKSGKNHNGG